MELLFFGEVDCNHCAGFKLLGYTRKQMAQIRTVIFDLDGTLIHSEGVAAAALISVFARYGVQLDSSHANSVVGRTWAAAFEILARQVSLPAQPARLLDETLEAYRIKLRTEVQEVPGAAAAVRRLAASFKLAVVSGSFREEVELALLKLGIRSHFDVVLGAEDYPRSKPAPDGYAMALGSLGCLPQETLIFEDSEAGIASGLASGCRVVSVAYCGSLPESSPWNARVHGTIDDWHPVTPEWVRAL